MIATLVTLLETIFPNDVYLQGTLDTASGYPASFVTYWTDDTTSESFYDDDENAFDWTFTVNVYSNNPQSLETYAGQIRTVLKAAGFKPQGKGYAIPSDVETHTGWTMEYIIRETITAN